MDKPEFIAQRVMRVCNRETMKAVQDCVIFGTGAVSFKSGEEPKCIDPFTPEAEHILRMYLPPSPAVLDRDRIS